MNVKDNLEVEAIVADLEKLTKRLKAMLAPKKKPEKFGVTVTYNKEKSKPSKPVQHDGRGMGEDGKQRKS